jgi:RHS repeat-associated protein
MPFVELAFINFNSDACTDLLFPGNGSTTQNEIYVSGCNGSVPETLNFGPVPVLGAMDWNGDGLTDILVQNGSTFGVYESTGNGLSGLMSTSVPYSASNIYFAFDADGDGLDDFGVWSETSPYPVSYFLHSGDGKPPDLLSSVTDGYGNFAKPTYSSIAQAAYSKGTSASYPDENYVGPLYVVNQTTYSDPSSPSGGTYGQSFNYYSAWMNLEGRGFEGFGSMRTYDSRTGVYDYWFYNPAFPYTGMPTAEYFNFPTVTTRYVQNTLRETELDSTTDSERYFPYISNTTIEHKELGGIENGEQIDTLSKSYTFDSYGNATQIVAVTTDNDPGSPYDGDSWTTTVTNTPDVDTGTWCLRVMSDSQISYIASDGSPSVTRTREYTPDTTECRYTQIETAPSSSYDVTEAFGYDSFGNVKSDSVTGTGMTARVTSANWGTTGQFPMSVTDASGATTQFNYNFNYGLVSSQTDPNSSASDPIVTSWQYGDGFGRLTQETRPDGTYTTYTYNNCESLGGCPMGGNTLALEDYNYNTNGSIETDGTIYYDGLERPIVSKVMMLSGTQWNRNEVRYDSLGRIVQQAFPCVWSAETTPCSYWATINYDLLNRLTEVQRPINQGDSTLQTTSYDYAGDTTTVTDPYDNSRTLIKDVNGWLRQTKDAMGYAVILGYDAAGAKSSVTDSLGNSLWSGTYAYGIAPFLVGERDIDMGAWGYTVDALGERTAWTDAKGQHFSANYDALSRPLTRTEPDLFTQWTWGASATSHNIGKLASVCSGTGSSCSTSNYSESESYDSLGRPFQRSVVIPAMGTYTYTSLYNATTGFLDTLTYPTGSSGKALELKYAYQGGLLQSITDILDSPNVTIWQANAQNPAGQITQETLGNGLQTNRAFDAVTQWLSSVQSGPGGGATIQNLSFLYDEIGNVTQRQDGIHDLSENFYYDNDYRLSYSTLGGTQNLSMTYDVMGDITNKSTVSNNATWTYDAVHLHQVREAGSTAYEYAYDANGNMTSWAGEPITWTSYNYPTKITDTSDSFTFAYAPDRSVWREVQTGGLGATTYRLGSPLMSIVVASSGTTDRNYIYAGNEPVAVDERTSASNTFYYLLTDHQGSISSITNSSAQVALNESFHPDGQRRNPTTWTDPISGSDVSTIQGISPRGYTFKETLEYMNLIAFGGRVGDVFTGRFLSADPHITDPTDPQSYNRYSYAVNNPVTYTDPTGFFPQDPDDNPEGGITTTLPPVPIPAPPINAYCGSNIFCVANTYGGTGVLEGNLANPLYRFGPQPSVAQPPGQQSNPQQSNPTSPTTLPTVTVTATVANDDSGFIDVAAMQNFVVQMNTSSYFHIFAFHVWFPIPGKSRYAPQYGNVNALNTILSRTVDATIGFPQPNGNYYFSSDLGFTVGIDQAGNPTSWNTVIVQPIQTPTESTPGAGVVVTMYPGQ